MRDAAWYVIQVQTGRETIVCKHIEQACQLVDENSCDVDDMSRTQAVDVRLEQSP